MQVHRLANNQIAIRVKATNQFVAVVVEIVLDFELVP